MKEHPSQPEADLGEFTAAEPNAVPENEVFGSLYIIEAGRARKPDPPPPPRFYMGKRQPPARPGERVNAIIEHYTAPDKSQFHPNPKP